MTEDMGTGHPLEGMEFPDSGLDPESTANAPVGDGTPDNGTAPAYEDPENSKENLGEKVEKLTKQLSDRDSYISKQAEELRQMQNNIAKLEGMMQG